MADESRLIEGEVFNNNKTKRIVSFCNRNLKNFVIFALAGACVGILSFLTTNNASYNGQMQPLKGEFDQERNVIYEQNGKNKSKSFVRTRRDAPNRRERIRDAVEDLRRNQEILRSKIANLEDRRRTAHLVPRHESYSRHGFIHSLRGTKIIWSDEETGSHNDNIFTVDRNAIFVELDGIYELHVAIKFHGRNPRNPLLRHNPCSVKVYVNNDVILYISSTQNYDEVSTSEGIVYPIDSISGSIIQELHFRDRIYIKPDEFSGNCRINFRQIYTYFDAQYIRRCN